ncbi:Protein AIR2 [Daldinia childiae]|uniref:Protein AIR2 n=1 Tax=Daldinia childiae TaxID=326645 RepID=UPI0014457FFA|nr:Protein AIR2 [Daldinia childiae]KAF3058699.1 Protein AIR2 [Daldinia childiae]
MSGATEGSAPNSGQGGIDTPSSLSSQKRSRDYAEQLKGLSPSDDEDHQKDTSLPALKKQKTGNSDSGDDSDLDDGEIVESSPNPSPAHAQPITEPSEDGEIDSPMAKPQESDESDQTFFIDKTGSKPVQHSGWNQGLSLGARTSFGKPAAHLFPPNSAAREDDDDERDRDYRPPTESPEDQSPVGFIVDGYTWYLPHLNFRAKKHSAHTADFFNDRIQTWILAFLERNAKGVDRVSTKVVREGFTNHLNLKRANLFKGAKKYADAATSAAQEAIDDASLGELATSANEPSQEDTTPVTDKREEVLGDEDELRQQRRYFPWAEDPAQHCLSCSGIGHHAHECPQRNCKFCGSQEHALFGCPTKQRCSKCRQLGHSSASCEEKLALASDEQGGCAICGAGHAEEWCSEIWRSFAPTTDSHPKVKDVPAFCYTCGGEGHYGPECGLPDRGDKVTGKTTWSQANRLLYIDQNSQNTAIAWVGVDRKEDFHILGRARKQIHTHFISSDESEEELVHAPIRKSETRSQIRIASNIGSLGQSSNRTRSRRNNDQSYRRQNEREFSPPPPPSYSQGNGNSSWQPPLPPGPPPPSQRNGYQGSLPSAPTSLPPRPPAFNQSPSRGGSGGRGGHFNRGGRGGRGRGRGRGRG